MRLLFFYILGGGDMRKFTFDKSYEEIDLEGKIYKIDMSDEAIKNYQLAMHKYHKEAQKLEKVDVSKLDFEEQKKTFNQALELQKKFIETILGKGTFDELYEKSGQSSSNMIDLVVFLGEVVGERVKKLKEKQLNRYLKNKKQFQNQKNHKRK